MDLFVKNKHLKLKMELIDNKSNIYKSENAMLDLNSEKIALKIFRFTLLKENWGKMLGLKEAFISKTISQL